MKELLEQYSVNLEDLYKKVPPQTNRHYSGSDKDMNFIFEDKEFIKRFNECLHTEDERNYTRDLVKKASEIYPNAGKFRTAISQKNVKLDDADANILIKIFHGSNYPKLGRVAEVSFRL